MCTTTDNPPISIVIATHNRRDVTLATLHRLFCLGAETRNAEIIVVDNASSDGTAGAIAERFPVQCVALDRNLGACAKARGVTIARGEIVVFLDDDSFPRPGSLTRMLAHFAADETLGAASFMTHLADGKRECCAFHNVFIGCGVGIRRDALTQVGGLDESLFMAAEEYDLSFRLINAGWRVQTFEDLHVDHLKSPVARASSRLVYYDTRNNLWLTARYLPDGLATIYRGDWAQRYRWIAMQAGHRSAYWRGYLAASMHYGKQRRDYASHRLSPDAVEAIFHLDYVERRMRLLRDAGVQSVLLADLGKNIYAFVRAARRVGVEVAAIVDDRFAAPGRTYRELPVLTRNDGLQLPADAIVVANTSPEQARRTEQSLRESTALPIHRWFDYVLPSADAQPAKSELVATCV
ncbi:MAG: glycosyltransferase [Phycisphaerales bacterium]|nr:glycosyltransferase [Phycisphaerales bacterium]